jgi:hypothetical protein
MVFNYSDRYKTIFLHSFKKSLLLFIVYALITLMIIPKNLMIVKNDMQNLMKNKEELKKTNRIVEDLNNLPVYSEYSSPYIELALWFGTLWSEHKERMKFYDVYKKFYGEHFYFWHSYGNKFYNWDKVVDFETVVAQNDSFILSTRVLEAVRNDFLKKFFIINGFNIDTLYFNDHTKDFIYSFRKNETGF